MTRAAKRLERTIGQTALSAQAVLLSAAASDRPEPHHPSLQGTWTLNEDLTARMRQDDQAQNAPRGGGHGGGMGRHGGGGGRHRNSPPDATPGRDSDDESSRQGPPPSFAALDVLTISQQGDQLTLTDKSGNTRVVRTDDHKVR